MIYQSHIIMQRQTSLINCPYYVEQEYIEIIYWQEAVSRKNTPPTTRAQYATLEAWWDGGVAGLPRVKGHIDCAKIPRTGQLAFAT